MYEDITPYKVALLTRALNSELNVINGQINVLPKPYRGLGELLDQMFSIQEILIEAQEKDAEFVAKGVK